MAVRNEVLALTQTSVKCRSPVLGLHSVCFCKLLLVKPCLAFESYWGSQEASPQPTLLHRVGFLN